MASRLIATGAAAKRLNWQRAEIIKRNAVFDDALGIACGGPRHAPHRWLPLRQGVLAEQAVDHLGRSGLRVVAGSSFAVGPKAEHAAFLRVSLGAAANHKTVRQAALLLKEFGGLSR